ncbi:DUF4276 family protein [Pseudomonas sp. Q1]|uniref:DUF4276 family protein n=1 Tax=Pseudomonas sp. Q1 TaxID=2202823 RepID=UPI001374D019|nr:DUF4276 family protein [Pseudomonas sp. Q1]NCE87667.1 hypothetical protein [Pseudomonas sp. Q1]
MQKRVNFHRDKESENGLSLTIFVEGRTDAEIVKNILSVLALKPFPSIVICNGKMELIERIKSLKNNSHKKYIALIDADEPSVPDSRAEAERQLGNPQIPVFCAVPTIEAWLFADEKIAAKIARGETASNVIKRMPLPESIPYPKYLASKLLRITKYTNDYSFLQEINIFTAAARSPSLRNFLAGIYDVLNMPSSLPYKSISSNLNREIFSTLLREIPGDSVAWKTLSGETYSAADLAKNIGEGTDIGKQYITELLRVARDLMSRKAKK